MLSSGVISGGFSWLGSVTNAERVTRSHSDRQYKWSLEMGTPIPFHLLTLERERTCAWFLKQINKAEICRFHLRYNKSIITVISTAVSHHSKCLHFVKSISFHCTYMLTGLTDGMLFLQTPNVKNSILSYRERLILNILASTMYILRDTSLDDIIKRLLMRGATTCSF